MEVEGGNSLPFLDVLVKRNDNKFIISVYRKPTFTGLYINWKSFVPCSTKVNVIVTLVHRTLMICSPCTLQQELDKIHYILCNNGYPTNVVKGVMERKIDHSSRPPVFGSRLCPIYLELRWLSGQSQTLIDRVSNSISSTLSTTKLRVSFRTCPIFPSFVKDRLSYRSKRSVIYKFKCQCSVAYFGRTCLRLETRLG